ncbi:MAG: hypothetical protein ACLFUJ_03985 [Phycisphaerae bacterium]
MTRQPEDFTKDQAITIDLETQPAEAFRDILDKYRGDWPTAHRYQVPSAMDVDDQADLDQGETLGSEGFSADAWISFEPGYARVMLNPHHYADTPADELQGEAQRILQDWARAARNSMGLSGSDITWGEYRPDRQTRPADEVADRPGSDRIE